MNEWPTQKETSINVLHPTYTDLKKEKKINSTKAYWVLIIYQEL